MNIIVCLKQVPDSTKVRLDPVKHTLIREGVESIINPYDLYALEAALRLKDAAGGKVTLLSMGPPQAETALREALSYGADDAVLLCDRAFAGADTWATSYTLAQAVRKLESTTGPFDVIFCGKQAIDGDTAQVGPGLAERLGVPHVAFARKAEMAAGEGKLAGKLAEKKLSVERLTDDGYDRLEIELPALLTVVKEIGEPRMPSLRAKMAAKKKEIPVWSAADIAAAPGQIGLPGSLTSVRRVFPPPVRGGREMISGNALEQAETLYSRLKSGVLALKG
ncbi:MAG: electron transfer flavoprotein subunit beta/FixA family protein [Pseudomonadota bacterium]